MDYPCTWWEVTDRMSEFQDGVCCPLYRSLETNELVRSIDLPIGALYALRRQPGRGPNEFPPTGADGLSIACVIIGDHGPASRSHWYIENPASNCTKPTDRDHRCWVRQGTVGEKLTVGKAGNTCAAGAGSFFMDAMRWHGFLRNGVLVQG